MAVNFFLPSYFPYLLLAWNSGRPPVFGFILAVVEGLGFLRCFMSTIPTADLLALDTDGIADRLSKLRGYL